MTPTPIRCLAALAIFAALATVLAGCPDEGPEPAPPERPVTPTPAAAKLTNPPGGDQMILTSSAFENADTIPQQYSGTGQNISPPLAWRSVPETARELALIVDDPDAPTPEPWVHWLIYALDPADTNLPQALPRQETLDQPVQARQGRNSFRSDNIGYSGPMPPPGHGVHHYHFRLYALDTQLNLQPAATREQLEQAMQNHIVAQTELVGTFER